MTSYAPTPPLRKAVALGVALATAVTPLFVNAQSAYEFKQLKQGLVVSAKTDASTPAPTPSPEPQPTPEAPTTPTPPPAPAPSAVLQLSTNEIKFDNIATNTSETRQVVVSNVGTAQLTFTTAPSVSGATEFAAGLTTCGSSLSAGADCLADATFSPTVEGSFSGVLKFTSTLANSPHEVTLVGTAFNPVSLAASVLPRGTVGQAYTYDFKQLLNVSNESSPDKSQATWNGSGTLPLGLSFNTSTGVLTGTPTTANAGTSYTITGTYKNNKGQQVYTIKVGDVALEVVQIEAGTSHVCAVTVAGAAKCWGSGTYYALGTGSTAHSSVPVQVPGLTSGVTAISAASTHSCAVHNGAAKCWGTNSSGQLGNSSTSLATNPAQVTGLTSGVSSVVTGSTHSCAIHNGAAKCWGTNNLGQLGNSSNTNTTAPVQVTGLTSAVVALTAGYTYTCALTSDGAARCWGYNYNGQLGNSSNTNTTAPVQVTGLTSGVSAISAGERTTCAVHNGAAKCWGYSGTSGMLGYGSATNTNAPVQVSGLTTGVAAISVGQYHACAVHNGAAKCWGTNTSGELGNSSTTSSSVPVQVTGLTSSVSSITTGSALTCAIAMDVTAKCWGSNGYGQLGDGTTSQRTAPVNVKP